MDFESILEIVSISVLIVTIIALVIRDRRIARRGEG